MSLSRRQFTREFKLAALQRLETGASVAEVARAFEVNPNVLHRSPASSVRWVSSWLFLGGLRSRRAHLCFTSRRSSCSREKWKYNRNAANGRKCL